MAAVRLLIGAGGPSCARRQMILAGLYKAQEPAGQFANPVLLTEHCN
jgi:hypothetical protein